MLSVLEIENIAVIESACINFGGGLNVLTGETGAGKSIVIDSINAILGERTSKELVRSGADSAKVTAVFTDIDSAAEALLDSMGIEKTEDSTLTVFRSISLSGKNTCRVNGWPVTVGKLKELGTGLINIHGQHDSQALLSPDKHGGFIDSLAENEELRREYRETFSSLVKVKKELDSLYDTRDETVARLDYLNYLIDEISRADIRDGETEELNKEKNLLQNSVKVRKSLDKAYSYLGGDGGIAEALAECAAELENAAKYYDEASETAKSVRNAAFEIGEYTAAVRSLGDRFTYSPQRLTEIDDRLDLIYRLSMKYGKTEKDILDTLEKAVDEKNRIGSCDEKIASLESRLYELSDRVKLLAAKLTETREKAAAVFEKRVTRELAFLDMPYVRFKVGFTPTAMTSKGAESMEFLISANPGQEPGPISKIASGGELSRIMLAIKNVLTDKDPVGTMIFDEIDAGVSGSAAEKIALKLDSVSRGKQVICVTHLSRIAAQADVHLKVSKSVRDGKTFTAVTKLDDDGRAGEIARITAGTGITELQLESAREMLRKAKENRI